ncbi:MAG: ABC transporter ATP-binding protein [Desulfurococcales archaeon]|nr:ABC transporter ATP-binding protein [Desulfurococcales archaeon]
MVKNLSKTYGSIVAVNNLSFSVDEGSIHGLVGPNGSGKTTTFKSIVGLTIPDSGEILLDNEPLLGRGGYRVRGKIGFSPETIELPLWLTVRDFLYLMARLDGLVKRDSEQLVENAIKEFRLGEFADTRISRLSKGQKKRVLIAQALIPEKRVYILDEPMTGLDPEWVVRIREILRSKANRGSSVIVSSHLLRELETVIDSVTIIKYGVALFTGKVDDLTSTIGGLGVKISVEVDNKEKALRVLLDSGLRRVEVKGDSIEAIVDSKEGVDRVVRKLVEAGVRVYRVNTVTATLEDGYMRLLRGK